MGPFGATRIQLAYAYHIPFNRKYKMSMGLFAGIQQFKIDVAKLNINTNQDPAVTGKNFAYLYPDVWPSIFFYSKDEFAGFTIRQAFKNKIKKITQDSRLRYHYVITAGKRFPFGNNKSVIPGFCFKWASVSAMEIDVNAMFEFGTRFQLGASWRNTDAVIGMARLNIKNYSVGYAFDFTTSKIKLASSNTHEIIVGINTCKPDKRNSAECYSFN
jgi:type IX secretion system PorP/SprF family membrane protein